MSNGVKRIFILIFIFYILVLLQTSFLIHFNFRGYIPNFILIAVILINFFAPHHFLGKRVQPNEWYEKWWGVSAALIGGFFLDIFSEKPIGISILIFVGLSFLIKIILKKYVRLGI